MKKYMIRKIKYPKLPIRGLGGSLAEFGLLVLHTAFHSYLKYNKLSRDEICEANFIPPCEWCKSGQLFCHKCLLG
jgi:hypothetical protein